MKNNETRKLVPNMPVVAWVHLDCLEIFQAGYCIYRFNPRHWEFVVLKPLLDLLEHDTAIKPNAKRYTLTYEEYMGITGSTAYHTNSARITT